MEPLSRDVAQKAGLKRYFSGKPCHQGHVDERYIKGRGCVSCAIEANKEKYRIERIGNLETSRIKRTLAMRRYRKKYPNPRAGKHGPEPSATKTLRIRNQEEQRLAQKRWQKNNPMARRVLAAARRSRQRDAGGRYTVAQILELLKNQKGNCANCLKDIRRKYHCDHIIPLIMHGRNDITNIQLLCPTCNAKKSTKDPIVFARTQGRLL